MGAAFNEYESMFFDMSDFGFLKTGGLKKFWQKF